MPKKQDYINKKGDRPDATINVANPFLVGIVLVLGDRQVN